MIDQPGASSDWSAEIISIGSRDYTVLGATVGKQRSGRQNRAAIASAVALMTPNFENEPEKMRVIVSELLMAHRNRHGEFFHAAGNAPYGGIGQSLCWCQGNACWPGSLTARQLLQIWGPVMGNAARFLRDNGLTIALMVAFVLRLGGMLWSGWLDENAMRLDHGLGPISVFEYGSGSTFLSALFENWESEFLQMSAYVIMTAMLFQRGSSESKDPDSSNPEDADPSEQRGSQHVPWPVRAGGLWLRLYSYSLGITLLALFVASFALHWINSSAPNRHA